MKMLFHCLLLLLFLKEDKRTIQCVSMVHFTMLWWNMRLYNADFTPLCIHNAVVAATALLQRSAVAAACSGWRAGLGSGVVY